MMVLCAALTTTVGGTGWLIGRRGRLAWLNRVGGGSLCFVPPWYLADLCPRIALVIQHRTL